MAKNKKQTTVIFHWKNHPSLNTPHAIKKLLSRWSYTCKAFSVYNLIAITDDNIKMSDTEINFSTEETLDDALKDKENIIYIEQGGTPLEEFEHPQNATYVFGSDYNGLKVDNAISINTKIPLHAEVAVGIILHSRSQQWHT